MPSGRRQYVAGLPHGQDLALLPACLLKAESAGDASGPRSSEIITCALAQDLTPYCRHHTKESLAWDRRGNDGMKATVIMDSQRRRRRQTSVFATDADQCWNRTVLGSRHPWEGGPAWWCGRSTYFPHGKFRATVSTAPFIPIFLKLVMRRPATRKSEGAPLART